LDDVSQTTKDLMAVHCEDPESDVSKLKKLVTEEQVKDHLNPTSPKVASPSNIDRDHPKTPPSQSKQPTQSSSGAAIINLNTLCSSEGSLANIKTSQIS
jgi:hypothetical protein